MIKWSPEWFRYNIKRREYPVWIEFIPGSTMDSLEYTKIIKKQLQRRVKTYGLEDCIESKYIISKRKPAGIFDFTPIVTDCSNENGDISNNPNGSVENSFNDKENDVSDINIEDNNYYINWLRNAVNEVTKAFTDSKSKVIITDSGLLSLLLSLYHDYCIGMEDVKNVKDSLFRKCKNGVNKKCSLGNKVFYRLIADTFEYDINEMQYLSEPDESSKWIDSVNIVLKLIQKSSFSLQYSPVTIVVGDNFRITDGEITKDYNDIFGDDDKEELGEELGEELYEEIAYWDEECREEEYGDNYYIENDEKRITESNDISYRNCMRDLDPYFREISQKVIYLNREYTLEEVISKIIKQINLTIYYQGNDSILIDTPIAEGKHTVLFRKPNQKGKITQLTDRGKSKENEYKNALKSEKRVRNEKYGIQRLKDLKKPMPNRMIPVTCLPRIEHDRQKRIRELQKTIAKMEEQCTSIEE